MKLNFSLFKNNTVINIFANYIGSAVSLAAPMIALPFLLDALGVSNWGLVSFSIFLVALISTFNSGISQAMINTFGSLLRDKENGLMSCANLLFGYERIYWVGSFIIGILIFAFSPMIAMKWLNIGVLGIYTATSAVKCAGIIFFVQLPAAIYRTILSARQNLKIVNIIQAIFAVIKSFGGVVVTVIDHSVILYLLFIILATFFETLSYATLTWRNLGVSRKKLKWNWLSILGTLKFSSLMSATVILGAMSTNIDRFYVSLKLSVDDVAIYTIALTLSLGVLGAAYPIYSAVLNKLVEVDDDIILRKKINNNLMVVTIIIISIFAIIYLALGNFLIQTWLGDAIIAQKVKNILNFLLVSSALNCIYNIAYINWVSLAKVRWIATINIICFFVALLIVPVAINAYGLSGAAAGIILMNSVGALCSIYWLWIMARQPGLRKFQNEK